MVSDPLPSQWLLLVARLSILVQIGRVRRREFDKEFSDRLGHCPKKRAPLSAEACRGSPTPVPSVTSVQLRGVHDPSAPEYKIVGLSAGGGGAEREPDEYRGHGPHAVTHHRNIPCRIIGYPHRSEVESRQPVNPAYSEELSGPDRIFQ